MAGFALVGMLVFIFMVMLRFMFMLVGVLMFIFMVMLRFMFMLFGVLMFIFMVMLRFNFMPVSEELHSIVLDPNSFCT